MSKLFHDHAIRRTALLLILVEFTWGMGTFFVLPATTVPAYLRALGASPLIVGVMAMLLGALPLMLQFFGRSVVERFPHRKRGIIILHGLVIGPYLLIPLCDTLLGSAQRGLLIALVVVLLACSQVVLGLVIPVWLDMVARVIPLAVRGSYFGISAGAFAAGGILGGYLLTWLQQWYGADVFCIAFLVTGGLFVLSMTCFACTPIPESAFDHPPEPSMLTRMRGALRACSPRTDFGRLVFSNMAQACAIAVLPFVTVYALDARGLGYPSALFSQITLWQALGGTVAGFLLGSLIDRASPRLPWMLITLIVPLSMLLLPHGGALPLLVLASLLLGVLNTHWSVTAPALLELSPPGDKSGYVAIANVANFMPAALAPVIFGVLINRYGYAPAFIAAAAAGLLAFAIALTLRNRPRQENPVDQALSSPADNAACEH